MRGHLALALLLLAVVPAASRASRVDDLIAAVAGDDERARARARQLLPREGVEAVPKLVALLNSDKEAVRQTAYNLLADFANQASAPGREADRAAVTTSLMTLLAPDQPGRLKELGLRLLPLVAPDGADIHPVAALLDDTELQEKARAALVEMGTPEARAELRNYIEKAKPEFQCALLDALGQLKDAKSLGAIAACARSEHPAVRAAAVRALAWTGDPTHLPTAKAVMSNADDATRWDAADAWLRLVTAIEKKGEDRQVAAGEYREMLKAAEPKIRIAGLAGLGRIGDGTCVGPILAAIKDVDRFEWAAGIEALRQMQGKGVVREITTAYPLLPRNAQLALLPVLGEKRHVIVLPVLTQAAAGGEAAFRTAAIGALGETALPEAIEPLTATLTAGHGDEKAAAQLALVRLGEALQSAKQAEPAGRAFLAALSAGSIADKELRRRAVAGLTVCPRPDAHETAKAIAADPEQRDLAVPLLVAVGDRLVAAKENDKAVQIYEAAMGLKPPTPVLRALADRMLRLGRHVDWAATLGIVRNWWVVGPFELGAQQEGWQREYISEPNVDLKARYMAGKTRLDWRRVTADEERGVVNLSAVFGKLDSVIAYAYTEIDVPAETDAVLRLGVDDSERVWVNGQKVFDLFTARGLEPDQDKVPVKLRAGTNTILLKVWQNTLGWEFCMRVTTPDEKPVTFTQKSQ